MDRYARTRQVRRFYSESALKPATLQQHVAPVLKRAQIGANPQPSNPSDPIGDETAPESRWPPPDLGEPTRECWPRSRPLPEDGRRSLRRHSNRCLSRHASRCPRPSRIQPHDSRSQNRARRPPVSSPASGMGWRRRSFYGHLSSDRSPARRRRRSLVIDR